MEAEFFVADFISPYRKGDKVFIRFIEPYTCVKHEGGTQSFANKMADFCGQVAEIIYFDKNGTDHEIDLDNGAYAWHDLFFLPYVESFDKAENLFFQDHISLDDVQQYKKIFNFIDKIKKRKFK